MGDSCGFFICIMIVRRSSERSCLYVSPGLWIDLIVYYSLMNSLMVETALRSQLNTNC